MNFILKSYVTIVYNWHKSIIMAGIVCQNEFNSVVSKIGSGLSVGSVCHSMSILHTSPRNFCIFAAGCAGAPGRRRFGDLSHLNRDPNREASAATVRGETLDEISNRYIEALGTCQKRISLWNEQDLVRDWQTTQEELRAVQEEFALVIEQRADLEKRQVELLQMRENLLQELEYWRDAPKRGCSIS